MNGTPSDANDVSLFDVSTSEARRVDVMTGRRIARFQSITRGESKSYYVTESQKCYMTPNGMIKQGKPTLGIERDRKRFYSWIYPYTTGMWRSNEEHSILW